MSRRMVTARLLAAITISALPAGWIPAFAESETSELSGVIRSSSGTPLESARLLAAGPTRGEIHRSEPTPPSGDFKLTGLDPGTYDLAVDVEGGLYLVQEPIYLVAGVKRSVRIAVDEEQGAAPREATAAQAQPSVWNNPLTAGAIVLGVAIVVGVLVENATGDETSVSPATTP